MDNLKERFAEFLKRHGISQNQAAQAMDYTGSVISQWMNDSYKGDVAKVEQTVAVWLEREGARRATRNIPIIETEVYTRIMYALRVVHEERDIGAIVGPSGIGKTTTFKAYVAANPGMAVYIECDSSMNKTAIMQAIARELDVDAGGEFTGLVRRVMDHLAGRDVLVIIDQADYLNDATLELLRQAIHDKGRSGLVLAGLERLEFRLKNVRNDHQQLLSRIGVFVRLEGLKDADAKRILNAVWPDVDTETQASFVKAAVNSTRRLAKLIERSHRIAIANKLETPTAEVVHEAGKLILK